MGNARLIEVPLVKVWRLSLLTKACLKSGDIMLYVYPSQNSPGKRNHNWVIAQIELWRIVFIVKWFRRAQHKCKEYLCDGGNQVYRKLCEHAPGESKPVGYVLLWSLLQFLPSGSPFSSCPTCRVWPTSTIGNKPFSSHPYSWSWLLSQ